MEKEQYDDNWNRLSWNKRPKDWSDCWSCDYWVHWRCPDASIGNICIDFALAVSRTISELFSFKDRENRRRRY